LLADVTELRRKEQHMHDVTSKDGTAIAFDRQGAGPAVILLGGGLDDGSENAPLVPVLADHFTVYNYARRGRGDSSDTQPYAVKREIEDLAALIADAGGSAHAYGVSSGGALALEAAAAGLPIDKLAVFEVPYIIGEDMSQRWRDYVDRLETALAQGRRGDAIELFMRLAGSSDDIIAGARSTPMWPALEALAHTLFYDAACIGAGEPPKARLATITQPTLVITGDPIPPDSPMAGMPSDFFERAADAIAASVPNAERLTFEGQSHVPDPKVVSQALERFFAA
jgi:pimeloyl-ACP methyl ester carboxylesterase